MEPSDSGAPSPADTGAIPYRPFHLFIEPRERMSVESTVSLSSKKGRDELSKGFGVGRVDSGGKPGIFNKLFVALAGKMC
jgi:hypothetical protein